MQVTHHFTASLTSQSVTTIPMMQGDGTRVVVAQLMAENKPWIVPKGIRAGLSYELPGKEPGYYDQLEDGSPACVIDENLVSVVLEPVLTAQAGPVQASIILRDTNDVQVATFPFYIWVDRIPGMAHGENFEAPIHGFEGKIYYGGPGGILIPLGLGDGVRTERQDDGSLLLVTGGGSGGIVHESDPTVPGWAKQPVKPHYTAVETGADPAGTAASAVEIHATDLAAHPYFHDQIATLHKQINAALNSEDVDLDQLAEIVAYIRSNRDLIDIVTTSKVSISDIVDNLVTNVANKPLSAAMGVSLAGEIDSLRAGKLDASKLPEAVSAALAQAKASGAFDGEDGITPHIGGNGNWFIGATDTGVKAQGEAGASPVRGVDYWTPADQEAIVQQVIAALGTPVFGRVDGDNNIILTGELADGTYTVKYEDGEGNVTQIGTLVHEVVSEPEPAYTNVIPLAINTDGTQYVGSNGEDGYKPGYRLNGTGAETTQTGTFVTGFIPVTYRSKIYLKNIGFFNDASASNKCYVWLYDADFNPIEIGFRDSFLVGTSYQWAFDEGSIAVDSNNYMTCLALKPGIVASESGVKYMRISAWSMSDDSVITIDEPIE